MWVGRYSDLLYLGFSNMVSSLRTAIQELFLGPQEGWCQEALKPSTGGPGCSTQYG